MQSWILLMVKFMHWVNQLIRKMEKESDITVFKRPNIAAIDHRYTSQKKLACKISQVLNMHLKWHSTKLAIRSVDNFISKCA